MDPKFVNWAWLQTIWNSIQNGSPKDAVMTKVGFFVVGISGKLGVQQCLRIQFLILLVLSNKQKH